MLGGKSFSQSWYQRTLSSINAGYQEDISLVSIIVVNFLYHPFPVSI